MVSNTRPRNQQRHPLHLLNKHPRSAVFLLAACSALFFSLLIHPRIITGTDYEVAQDGYDRLAQGLLHYGTLSYYPSTFPTVLRGPAYPAFIAALLAINGSWYPQSVQCTQALFHGCTALLAYGIGLMLFDRKRAFIAGLLTALHPYLIWYASKAITESFSTFLFTAVVFCVISLARNPGIVTTLLLGFALGVSSLCKASFLPLALLTPVLLALSLSHKHRVRFALGVLAVALLLVAPWTIRNYNVTHQFIPVHSLLGYNLRVGDVQAEFYEKAPLSFLQLLSYRDFDISSRGDTISHYGIRNAETMTALRWDNELLSKSLHRYIHEPLLVLRKLLFGPIMFWTLSSTPLATVIISLLQLPLLAIFTVSAVRTFKTRGVFSVQTIPIILVMAYFAFHIPIFTIARFSVVLVPTMLVCASGWNWRNEKQIL